MLKSIFVAPIILGFLGLQVFLSLRKNKWLGVILPTIYVLFSLVLVLGNPLVSGGITLFLAIAVYVLMPAGINLVIYLACRAKVKVKKQKEIEKMSIQDLN
jgi:predicted RND superfamily exporter protein